MKRAGAPTDASPAEEKKWPGIPGRFACLHTGTRGCNRCLLSSLLFIAVLADLVADHATHRRAAHGAEDTAAHCIADGRAGTHADRRTFRHSIRPTPEPPRMNPPSWVQTVR